MRRTFIKGVAALTLAAVSATTLAQAPAPGAAPAGGAPAGGPPRSAILVESNAFPDGGIVPLKYSLYGSNTMPDFKLSSIPANAQTIAVILHDLDVASGGNPEDNLHWLAWNIPVTGPVTQIEEGKLPEGAVNGRGRGYTGMGAPNGARYHHYVFEFYALNSKLDLLATPGGRNELLEAMKGKVVGKAAYVGRFRNDTNAVMQRAPGAGGPGAAPGGAPPPRPAGQ